MKINCIKGRGLSITSLDEDKTMIVTFERFLPISIASGGDASLLQRSSVSFR